MQFHERQYYVKNEPLISDKEYDILFQGLKELETSSEITKRFDSPTQRVSSDLSSEFELVNHFTPMLSLANSYNAEDLKEFDTQIRKLTNLSPDKDINYFVEPKLDGGSIALVYENDFLVRAATRGNGAAGENMTRNAKTLSSVPLSVPFSKYGLYKVELRGEAVIAKDIFDRNNKSRELEGLDVFANPRNAASGGLRMKDPNESRKRGLEVFIFQMAYAVDQNGTDKLLDFDSHNSIIDLLEELGFKIPKGQKRLAANISEAFEIAKSWEDNREAYNYEIDGAVVKVNDLRLQEMCGATQHHPRWAIAFKFKAKQATTTLLEVEYQVGKTGAITPVAKVDPVHLAGVTVSSISMHNEEFILGKDLHIGDKVLIERAGDVIPYIVKAQKDLRDSNAVKIKFISACPSCSTKLVQPEGEAAWRCPNYHCPDQSLQRIIYHVSKEAMDIDGFGKSNVEKFNQLGWLKDISDVYNLDYDAICDLEGFGKRSSSKLKASIDKAKGNPIHRLLNSLSIHHLGKKASQLIAENIRNVFELQTWDKEKFTEIKDIGPVVADNVIQWFSDSDNLDMLKRMESYGVNMNQLEADQAKQLNTEGILFGKTILFTGTLQQMGRKQAQTLAEKHGAKNISAVSANLNILVVGEKAGSKLKKAQALGSVTILTEEDFLNLINNEI